MDLLVTVSTFLSQQGAGAVGELLETVGASPLPEQGATLVAVAAASASASATSGASMGATGKAAAAAAAAATGWAVVNDHVPPATEILSYAILEAAAELKLKMERKVFRGSNVALGVLLLPIHVLKCGLRALGWAPVMVRDTHHIFIAPHGDSHLCALP